MVQCRLNRENAVLGIEPSGIPACRYTGQAYNPDQSQIWARLNHLLLRYSPLSFEFFSHRENVVLGIPDFNLHKISHEISFTKFGQLCDLPLNYLHWSSKTYLTLAHVLPL